jgi:hypothetical protein
MMISALSIFLVQFFIGEKERLPEGLCFAFRFLDLIPFANENDNSFYTYYIFHLRNTL